jgi:signal transduction histidine kinase
MRENGEIVYVCVDEVRFDQLTADVDALQRANARQSLAMATAGHDLRQHLQTIVLVLDLLRPTLVDEQHLESLATAREQVRDLTCGLEALAREADIGVYTNQHERSSFPIATLLTRIERKWLPAAQARNLQLRIDRSPARVWSNPDLLFAVIDNLVSNAIKHTDRGSVGVHVRLEEDALLVSIEDTGPGIDSEKLGAIFEPDVRGTDKHAGMGLGLAIVQTSASLLDHPISINSLVGRGTCFTLHVPLGSAAISSSTHLYATSFSS